MNNDALYQRVLLILCQEWSIPYARMVDMSDDLEIPFDVALDVYASKGVDAEKFVYREYHLFRKIAFQRIRGLSKLLMATKGNPDPRVVAEIEELNKRLKGKS